MTTVPGSILHPELGRVEHLEFDIYQYGQEVDKCDVYSAVYRSKSIIENIVLMKHGNKPLTDKFVINKLKKFEKEFSDHTKKFGACKCAKVLTIE